MLGLAIKGLIGAALLGAGWFGGTVLPLPQQWVAFARERAAPIFANIDVTPEGLARLRDSLSADDFSRLTQNAAEIAARTGGAILVQPASAEEVQDYAEAAALQPISFNRPAAAAGAFETALSLCPGMRVSNAPRADEQNQVRNYTPVVSINGIAVAVNPTRGACLSSGVGPRNGRTHKGLDFFSRNGGPIMAAADGIVIERLYRDDYGNVLLIDHGQGVYTRYAHLSSFAPGVTVGARVRAGQQIGLMGNTAAYAIPVHLHYEVLLGDYANPRASFGLTARSPFEFAPAGVVAVAAVEADQLTRDDPRLEACPGGPVTTAATITIRRGDSLGRIARACYGREDAWRQIVACNAFLGRRNRGGISTLDVGHLLYVGDRLTLPAPGQTCAA